jgi:AcrR family transcriptional regulator
VSDAIETGGEGAAISRRAPFAENPRVGQRGVRSQKRILDAALRVFDEVGYHQAGIIRITEVAGCSRAAFYQYFSSKEDVFRHLAADVARQLMASTEALPEITADAAGWKALRAWIDEHAEIYGRSEPVFQAFQAAAASDEAVASGAARIATRQTAAFRAKVPASTLPPRRLDAVIALLLNNVTRTHRICDVLRVAVPNGALPTDRIYTALTDVLHRTLFGLDEAVNVREAPKKPLLDLRLPPALVESLQDDRIPEGLSPTSQRTVDALLAAAQEVLVARGYHVTRVDDITALAGVSHGAFYRYFENKNHIVRAVAIRAMTQVGGAFTDIPDPAAGDDPTALRRWLRRYARASASQAAVIRAWVDGAADDPFQSLESAAALNWGRSRLVRYLEPRGFGDVDTEALLFVVLLDALGSQGRSQAAIEAAALFIERGLLGSTSRTDGRGFGSTKARRQARITDSP